MAGNEIDIINRWSEIKLDIIKSYASEYSKILTAQTNPSLYHIYIDAFAGSGVHISKTTDEYVLGSPLNALNVTPPFKMHYLIDIDGKKVAMLQKFVGKSPNVKIYEGDCNKILLEKVFPEASFKSYRRALCLLDPYGLHLDWEVISEAGEMKSIEIFLNFPVEDMNRNVLWRCPEKVSQKQLLRMNRFWGDESWRKVAYVRTLNLFGWEQKTDNETIAEAFQERLKNVARFAFVPKPLPMRNSNGATVYYLFFASQKPVAQDIVEYIFDKHREN